jgi:predicted oxidoreductase (fatty acid repression mutant protein)
MGTTPNDDRNADASALRARIDERTANIQHRVQNMETKFDTFLTRREADQRFESQDSRLVIVEGSIRKGLWAIASAWLAGIGVFISLIAKKFS